MRPEEPAGILCVCLGTSWAESLEFEKNTWGFRGRLGGVLGPLKAVLGPPLASSVLE